MENKKKIIIYDVIYDLGMHTKLIENWFDFKFIGCYG